MARARNIKPGFYKNEDLAECSFPARLMFPGLWQLADREGRLEDRPRRIKGELFPFDSIEVEPLLAELERWKFIIRYEIDGRRLIQIRMFLKHQRPHRREQASVIPAPPGFVPPSPDEGSDGGAPGTDLPPDGVDDKPDLGHAKDRTYTDPDQAKDRPAHNRGNGKNPKKPDLGDAFVGNGPVLGPDKGEPGTVAACAESLLSESPLSESGGGEPSPPGPPPVPPSSKRPLRGATGKILKPPKKRERPDLEDAPSGVETWNAYSAAYLKRYGVEPTRNALTNSHMLQVVKRLGAEEAPKGAAFYVSHNNGFYTRCRHGTSALLSSCEALRTDWATGRMTTDAESRQIDRNAANGQVWSKVLEGATDENKGE